LEEAILRQADNLFLLRIPYEDDVRHVSRGAATDFATMDALVRRLATPSCPGYRQCHGPISVHVRS
jgi:hypothetical protein